ncbi:hypothetical protein GZ77_06595 [Endozoicomonas montiporae]|uniref:Deoxynucleoside kinase domain-containing protein n=2 Tax=Endozoicomonas montiporae TaxID=1027273 RepID=A0A081N6P7_9GAMM|nr:deoxynucleoside kinase [Endozoicomonas montiporae]AMO56450.1 deoxynucleoside kinase [Endozoicomonas montiporae CL-33]KEQ14120.1 hypothetical protein GZ77_06595 [Endozoicomonas montiporae]
MTQTNHFVAVEANIAAGKSTLLPKLAEALDWDPIQEPAEDPEFARLLGEFTKNPTVSGNRIRFQSYITQRRAEIVENLPANRNYLIKRSLYSDLIFTQANFLSMEQPDTEFMLHYCEIQKRLKDYPRISAVVYLHTTPEKAHERLQSRGREAEDGTPFEYIRDIHNYHEAILPQICASMNTPLVTMDWNDFGCEHQVAQQILDVIRQH